MHRDTFYSGAVPQDLFIKNSFVVMADRGAGKTAIRKHFVQQADIDRLSLQLLNKDVF